MRAMLFDAPGQPLRSVEAADPVPGRDQVLVKVGACGLCRTDLHVVDGELQHPKLPLIPGHQVVGEVASGGAVETIRAGDRVGVPWLGWTCGMCQYCTTGRENLCDKARFTGYDIDGGYAEYTVADSRYCFPIDRSFSDIEAAPLLCAGLIGYRSLRMAGDGLRLGLYGFGGVRTHSRRSRRSGRSVYAITRPGDVASQQFALHLGATWAGQQRRSTTSKSSTRRSSSRRSERSCRSPSGAVRKRGNGGVRRHPHERDSGILVWTCSGVSGRCARWPI